MIIYMPGELEVVATLRFDKAEAIWIGDPVPRTITYLDGSSS